MDAKLGNEENPPDEYLNLKIIEWGHSVKHINLMSLVQASDSLAPLNFISFLNLHGIKIKMAEITDLKSLLKALLLCQAV